MTKKDYELIAASIRKHGNNKEVLALDLAARLQCENPHFDRARFLKACGF